MIDGILAVDKPLGWTSHDVVARCRALASQRQVGHAGTLDPLATGVLVLVLGTATRLSSYLMGSDKVYHVDVVLGATTITDDAEAPPRPGENPSHLTADEVSRCLLSFRGNLLQVPPAYAAIRQGGEKLYALARKGIERERPPRGVTIHHIDLLDWAPPHLQLRVHCGSGTYMRALARDIGAALGVGGYVHALRRERSGHLTLDDCCALDALAGSDDIAAAILPPDRAVLHLPAAVLSEGDVEAVRCGRAVCAPGGAEGEVRLHDEYGTLVGLARADGGRLKPFRVFEGGRQANARRL